MNFYENRRLGNNKKTEGGFSMKESWRTYSPGVRTSAVRYESGHSHPKKVDEPKDFKPVRQGNRKYTVSPIYSEKIVIEKTPSHLEDEVGCRQGSPIVVPEEPAFGQSKISDETQYSQTQENGPTLVMKRKQTDLSGQK